ncbi:MAG: hypothetical protein IJ241_02315 [Clostridia bacterium]|nr:hypothetical protein [Clostridia bacterium]MBQ8926302.1 hypothetical protein [Clostridia bacterium]
MFALKTILEFTAIVLLLVGWLNEDKVAAFERALWKQLKARFAPKSGTASAHSATYNASRAAEQRAWEERERIARSAEYARKHAVLRRVDDEPKRVA